MAPTQGTMNKIEEVRAKLQAQAERVAKAEAQAVRGGARRSATRSGGRSRVSQRRIANGFLIALLLILIGGTGGVLYSTYTTYLDTQNLRASAENLSLHIKVDTFRNHDFSALLRTVVRKEGEPIQSEPAHAAATDPTAEPAAMENASETETEPAHTVESATETLPITDTSLESEPVGPEPATEEPATEEAPLEAPADAPAHADPTATEAPAEPAPQEPGSETPEAEPRPEDAPEPPPAVEPAPRTLPFAP